ncbi:MAG: hypothetical protein QXU32_10370 [Nitrososphaerales archaeon]
MDSKVVTIGILFFAVLAGAFGYWQYQQLSGLEQEKFNLSSKIRELESQVDAWKATNEHNTTLIPQLVNERDRLAIENSDLKIQYNTLATRYGTAQTQLTQLKQELDMSVQPPYTSIYGREISWSFKDSKGNLYKWNMPIESYRNIITMPEPKDMKHLKFNDGRVVTVRDHTKFVESYSFTNVIDQVYDNAGSDYQFLFEVWYIVSQLTTYSVDIEDNPRWSLETFTESGGDCEDTTILIASMLKSSKHTKNWKIQMVFFDSYNPDNPRDINHVALYVETSSFRTFVESTAKSNGLGYWGSSISGWYFDL